jgi:hypothetical protein
MLKQSFVLVLAVLSAMALPSASAQPATVLRTAVIVGEFTIGGTLVPVECSAAKVKNTMFTDPDGFSVSQAFREASYGKLAMTGDVFGPYRVTADEWANSSGRLSCGRYGSLAVRLRAVAESEGVVLAQYDRVVYVLPFEAGCSTTSGQVLGISQDRTSFVFDCTSELTYQHELGHTFGLGHTPDVADPMNNQSTTLRLFNAAGALALNWIAPEAITTVTANGTHFIAPLELTRAQTSIPQIQYLQTSANRYVLSYRQPYGVDRRMGNTQNDLRINLPNGTRDLVRQVSPGGTATLDNVTIRNAANSPTRLTYTVQGLAGGGTPPPAPPPSCIPSATSLCLRGGRFKVAVTWRSPAAGTGNGTALPFSNDTGYFWFFDRANPELAVKVLDGTALNGRFWVFFGGLTDQEYTITVTDLTTNRMETYFNPLGRVCGGNDTAFGETGFHAGSAPVITSGQSAPRDCVADADTLCLRPSGAVIAVEVTWRTAQGLTGTGTGQFLPNTTQAGSFTFFDPANVELLVKALDGRALNGKYWVFTGGLSNVEYRATFTNVQNGRWVTVHNPLGNYCGSAITDKLQ